MQQSARSRISPARRYTYTMTAACGTQLAAHPFMCTRRTTQAAIAATVVARPLLLLRRLLLRWLLSAVAAALRLRLPRSPLQLLSCGSVSESAGLLLQEQRVRLCCCYCVPPLLHFELRGDSKKHAILLWDLVVLA